MSEMKSKRSDLTFGGSVVLVAAASAMFFLACKSMNGGGGGSGAKEIATVPAGAVDPKVDRYRVPVGDAPVKGDATAKVTIIEFSDFQCPFCSRVVGTIEQIEKAYPKDVRIAFKNNPLPFHPNATPAAKAAVAAAEQGKFWEMHDMMFKNQQALTKDDLTKYAKAIGLDAAKFSATFDSPKTDASIKASIAEAAKFGARGTPSFFVNGRSFSGAQPFEAFKKVIDEEIVAANTAIKAGVGEAQVYDALTKAGKTAAADAPKGNAPPSAAPAAPDPNIVYRVPVGASPAKGGKEALVTIVEFSDFQCPFCSRVEDTVTQVEKEYGDKVKIVWKNNPLPFHNNAMPAATVALLANEKGKFWEAHDLLFKNQQKLDRPSLEQYGKDLGLDAKKLADALDAMDPKNTKPAPLFEKYKKSITEDQAMAAQLGARGTPSFFINGKNLRGAQPFPAFKTVIDAAIVEAEGLLKKGVKKADLYTEITKNGKDKAEAPTAAPAANQPRPAAPPSDTTVFNAPLGDAPVKGPKNARVTIIEWSDYQCPFCGRVEPTIDQLLKAYPNDVRFAFKELPLPFHPFAHPAAEAALAAKEQGKFWEMHDIMYKNQTALTKDDLVKYATEIGLNVDKFKAAVDSGKYKAKVDQEMAEGNKIGARGTPSFFVNGKSFVGAQPFEAFKAKVEEELKNADALMASKHVKADKVYDELMKDAKSEVPAPAPAPAGAAAGAPSEAPVNVVAGNGPSQGPANAPVQIVEFSDFQCPFCSKVVPTVHQILDKYKGKVRLTWRNFPLPFHPNAAPAAEAAMAANAQGKFFEMHDKLFGNQQQLGREGYEKFAGEIGLNMDKFKKDLDAHTYKAAIDADVAYAGTLPGGGMGTPTFFINGRKIAGAYPFEEFAKIIDDELKKKGK